MPNTNTPSLGALLRQRIDTDAAEHERAVAEEERQRKEKENSDMACVKHFYANAKQSFTEQILANGRVKPIRVESFGENGRVAELLQTFRKPPSSEFESRPRFAHTEIDRFYPLWVEFDAWAKQNGLKASWEYEHDGMGIKSWYMLTVNPA